MVMGGFRWLLVVMGGFRWLFVVMGGYGWLRHGWLGGVTGGYFWLRALRVVIRGYKRLQVVKWLPTGGFWWLFG